jgi:hypothetical protein
MSAGLASTSAAKSNEKLINQKYATLSSSWMPFKSFKKSTYLLKCSNLSTTYGSVASLDKLEVVEAGDIADNE